MSRSTEAFRAQTEGQPSGARGEEADSFKERRRSDDVLPAAAESAQEGLIVEDDKNINKLMALSIGKEFEINQLYDGGEAIHS